jgi:glycine oxidase
MSVSNAHSPDVIVIGGGVIGCMLAYDLTRAGATVELIERGDLAREASAASAGIISPPTRDMGARTHLVLTSFRRYPGLLGEVEEQVGRRIPRVMSGRIEVSADPQALRATFDWQRRHEIEATWLDFDEILRVEPAANPETIQAGIIARDAFGLSLRDFCLAVADAAASLGAAVTRNTPVYAVEVEGDGQVRVRAAGGDRHAGTVIVAAGPWCDSLLASFALPRISIPVRGEMLRLSQLPVPIRHVLSGFGGYLVPQEDGACHAGATENWASGFDKRVSAAGLKWLIELAARFAPSLIEGHVERIWAGLRPGSVDQEPIIGPLPGHDNVWLATGHFRSGAQLAPATAEFVTRSLTGGSVVPELAQFSPARLMTAGSSG